MRFVGYIIRCNSAFLCVGTYLGDGEADRLQSLHCGRAASRNCLVAISLGVSKRLADGEKEEWFLYAREVHFIVFY